MKNTIAIAAGTLLLAISCPGAAQTFPTKPIRIISAEAGGGADFAARIIAQGLSAAFGQQVIVENRGGSATIPAQAVAQSAPDGHTLLVYGNNLWILPLIQNTPYDPLKDFAAITLAAGSPNIIVVHPSLPVKKTEDLIALAKAKPGALNYGTAATGGSSHLAAELFNAMAGVKITRIPYKGTALALNDLMGGQLHLMFATVGTVMPHVNTGRLRAIATTSPQPSPLVPGIPTVASAGMPGYEAESAYGFWAPAATPAAIVKRLSEETAKHLTKPETKERLFNSGVVIVGNTPEQFTAFMKTDSTRMGKVIKAAGIRID